jgi:putative ATP-dependent endonuclease of the OLD family
VSAADSGVRLTSVRVRGFRSVRDAAFEPQPVTALVGEARSGKSNMLAALRALLDPTAPRLAPEDVTATDGVVRVEAGAGDGRRFTFAARPPEPAAVERGGGPGTVFFPAALRSGPLIGRLDSSHPVADRALELFARALRGPGQSSEAAPALAFLRAVETAIEAELTGVLLLVEEPELFLRPQGQRYLYRLLRMFAAKGNQVIYSTHAPTFLNVGRLGELVLVHYDPGSGTRVAQPHPLPAEEPFRVVSEFDAERSELFLARAAVLVEGRTEKVAFPALFHKLGHDPDRLAITIVECGGKSNIPVFARICSVCGVPFLSVHDRDAPPGKDPIPAEMQVNALIRETTGAEHTVELAPDFEGVAGFRARDRKPEKASAHLA